MKFLEVFMNVPIDEVRPTASVDLLARRVDGVWGRAGRWRRHATAAPPSSRPRERVRPPQVQKRDPKGLYKRARAGEIKEFTGISAPYEEPAAPDISVDTSGRGVEECLDELVAYVNEGYKSGENAQAAPTPPGPPTALEELLGKSALGKDFRNIVKFEKGAAGVLFGLGVAVGLLVAALVSCCCCPRPSKVKGA